MRAMLFGATGMVGQGVLRECLLSPDVVAVLAVGRTATGQRHPKLHDLVHPDLLDLPPMPGYDACFFCLGVSSAGMDDEAYRRVTYDLTLSVARTLAAHSPDLTFVYVSGQGTGRGGSMWARVKGETEDALLALPTTEQMGRAMLALAREGAPTRVLETVDIAALAFRPPGQEPESRPRNPR